ncbi:Uncharacterised protein [Candidatus Azoamicus ciliaticola]|uniref:Sulfatase-modifying factor enzyme-like domain-containing protein n=2 Tax=Candidatus Azoamicus ciliaticola TaxID=2652803 RepID=A0A6J5JZM5_9GAMM|nr:Uncharacterised protein [Candidatus Azoamicus ciliaticola]
MNSICKFLFLNLFLLIFCNECFCRCMVFIPNGNYVPLFRNSNLDYLEHEVDSFYLDKYQVTNFDYLIFVLNNPFWDTLTKKDILVDDSYLNYWSNIDNFVIYADKPVVNVSWFSSDAFCNFYDSRLPSVDEWEYVGSVGAKTINGKSEPGYFNLLSLYINSSLNDISTVFDMPCNFFGACGIHFFLWEWVHDFNSVILINTDAEGGGLEELLYCGATSTNAIDPADYIAFLRFAFRNTLDANYTMIKLGFRCAKDK